MIPRPIQRLIDDFQKLPGIGPKTAQRLAFYIMRMPAPEVERFAQNLAKAKSDVTVCSICKNIDEADPCNLCTDTTRQQNLLAVVSSPLDLISMERAGFKGVYHVLHGVLDPLNGVGPEELYLDELISRVSQLIDQELEIVLATSTGLEGESTALYILRLLREQFPSTIKITRLARGLPVGGDVEYADEITLSKALEGRVAL
ncbi:recombination mediator RecR [Patescibacteria group bacterium]|nr:recombination mediator RecR [Patescibacteria group bacterium]